MSSNQWRTTVSPARKPKDVIHHSDKGSQYTSWTFGHRCRGEAEPNGVRPSTGTAGDALDNAICESVFATLDCELIDRHRSATRAEAQIAVFRSIEGFDNPSRRHSSIGYMPPAEFEDAHHAGHRRTVIT